MLNIPIVALIGLGTWYFDRKAKKTYNDAQKLNLVPIGLSGNSPDNLYLDLQITNASETSFKIDSFTANIYFKDTLIGTVYRLTPFEIKPTNNSIIKLQVKLKAGEAVATFITLFLDKTNKYKQFRVLGAFKYYGINFPIDKTINLNNVKPAK